MATTLRSTLHDDRWVELLCRQAAEEIDARDRRIGELEREVRQLKADIALTQLMRMDEDNGLI
jgi:hypothetical protein